MVRARGEGRGRSAMGESTSPISVILVSSGSRGNKLLFRFPFQRGPEHPAARAGKPRSQYAVNSAGDNREDQEGDSRDQCLLTDDQLVSGFSDVILATILATKSDMCGKKFELKIDNVRFVGHPTLLQHALGQVSKTDPSPKREMPTMILFNVVFALRANADPSVINCLHNLSRRIAIVLQHEERRCQYLTREAKLILAIQDEVSAMSETTEGPQSPFHHILPKCKLARDLKEAYDSLCTTGVVRLHINNWLEVSFCLPHKIHYVATNFIPPEAIERSLKSIRPYHALLLLNDEKLLLSELPLDCSPALVRVIKTTSAVKNLQQLAQDADLALLQTQLIQMVIWMLQHRLLIQLHTYVCLMVSPIEEDFRAQDEDMPFTTRVGGRSLSTPNALSFGSPTSSDDMTLTSPSMDNSSAELIPGGDSPLNKRMTENLLASLSEHEREAILNVSAAQNPEDLRMFARLLHYFRGRHHLEEIMYNENMRRSQLLMLFDKFRSVLVVTNHEDPVISVFQSLLK
ncbi:GATOR1 complex protein NPRL3 isoform X5 [Alligator mississippiensis]|uniref:GATOR1 complex protein NPRL3 isoform X5 n=1 Tax=Alligator mississippiensis TaxID=8496 RepID=UPI002877DE41|nr:GATOR1 complex protein NPRL3 isoform X5 [Alligator mississippiensis]